MENTAFPYSKNSQEHLCIDLCVGMYFLFCFKHLGVELLCGMTI